MKDFIITDELSVEKIKNILGKMRILDTVETDTHFIMRVMGGWIFTDRRGMSAVGTFVPHSSQANKDLLFDDE